ncbi:NADH-quinone oxidoreductase subunit A [Pontibacter akesuensis]|uniref:NADH-quinone oxidoreductase subunit A n=1 Tax=Pontibacter akesuensis TaxID=388950 RepID=A0A1I7HS47_9BACT|nr:NADH-quinone oxidoreductase subunit A [Pontibacter akesuensis]GHA63205.1 NADH-quinone oxidoreductase subunit A [Pontibacter akesuensis]SFU63276.1 NADH dehydrogenase subunit A [Pontibacter akesuensis]
MAENYASDFGTILLFLVGGAIFVVIGMLTSRLIRPNNPNAEKLTTYESGEEPIGSAWVQFNPRFYVVALIFIIFDVELAFLFPWATVFGRKELIDATDGLWGWFALAEMFIFIGVLVLGLAYAWAKGHLDWIKPKPILPQSRSKIPMDVYRQVNARNEAKSKASGNQEV